MKIFFNASLSGKKEYGKNYEAILKVLESELYKLLLSPVNIGDSSKVPQETTDQATTYYKSLQKVISQADIAVFEVSHPSTGIGHEITLALEKSKPVIAMHIAGRNPYVLESMNNDKLQVIEYTTASLEKDLKDALEYASDQQDTRFNFFISPKISTYLDWIAKERRVPRAVYLRKLIEDDIQKRLKEEEEL